MCVIQNLRKKISLWEYWWSVMIPWDTNSRLLGVTVNVVEGKKRKADKKLIHDIGISSYLLAIYFDFLRIAKGQIISKHFFSGQGFFQNTNENTSHTSKNEFIRLFFGSLCYFFVNWLMKLKCPNLLNILGTMIQENYWPFYPSEPFTLAHFNMRHPVQ